MTTKHISRICINESAKLVLKKVKQIIKNLSMWKRSRTILNYVLNTGNSQIINFTHRYLGAYKSCNPNSKRCSLCLHEKLEIVDDPKEILLKKRSEDISQCRHRNKYKLKALVSIKMTKASHNIQAACWRFTRNICCEDFPNS